MFLNFQDYHLRDEIALTAFPQCHRFKVSRSGKVSQPQKRIKFPISFVDAVDYTPNVHAPINFVSGACQRIGRAQEYYRSLASRFFDGQHTVVPPVPQDAAVQYHNYTRAIQDWGRHVQSRIDTLFSFRGDVTYSLEDWLSHSSYTEARKRMIRKCDDIPRTFYRVETFIKKEAYPEIKPPRLINSREDAFKRIVGPFTHEIEKDIFSSRFTIKGLAPSEQIARVHDRLSHCKSFLCTDYSKWESSVTVEVMRHVESLLWAKYKSPYPWDFHSWFLDQITNNHIYARGVLKASVKGVRMSGDMHTSLGNTFLNIVLTDYICSRMGITWDGFFEGDDGIIGLDVELSPARLQQFSAEALSLGFSLTMEYHTRLIDCTFLSRHIVDRDTAFREPLKAIVHAQWSFSLHLFDAKMLMRSRGFGLINENPGCPILFSLGRCFLRYAGAGSLGHVDHWYREFYNLPVSYDGELPQTTITPKARAYFQELFNIPVGLQISIEDALESGNFPKACELITALVNNKHPDWVHNYFFSRLGSSMMLDHYDYCMR